MYTRAHACDVCANTWIIPSTVSTSERSWVKLFDIRDLRQSARVLFCHKPLRVGLKTTLKGRCCFLFRALRFYGMSVECSAYIDSTKKERLFFFLHLFSFFLLNLKLVQMTCSPTEQQNVSLALRISTITAFSRGTQTSSRQHTNFATSLWGILFTRNMQAFITIYLSFSQYLCIVTCLAHPCGAFYSRETCKHSLQYTFRSLSIYALSLA